MSNDTHWLAHAALRAQDELWTLGRRLSLLGKLEGRSAGDIATELNCDDVIVQWLFLCRAPSGESFSQDVEQIASRYSVDAKQLAAIIRRADAVIALGAETHVASESILLAARDHEDSENPS